MTTINKQSGTYAWLSLASIALISLTLVSCGSKEKTGTPPGSDTSASTSAADSGAGTATASQSIPGLTADDAAKALKAQGLTCGEPTTQGGTMIWKCKQESGDHMYDIAVAGSDATTIRSVSATSVSFGGDADATAKKLLGDVASLPYTGAEPAAARKWVEENVGKTVNKTFGGVKFELTGSDAARVLTISNGSY